MPLILTPKNHTWTVYRGHAFGLVQVACIEVLGGKACLDAKVLELEDMYPMVKAMEQIQGGQKEQFTVPCPSDTLGSTDGRPKMF